MSIYAIACRRIASAVVLVTAITCTTDRSIGQERLIPSLDGAPFESAYSQDTSIIDQLTQGGEGHQEQRTGQIPRSLTFIGDREMTINRMRESIESPDVATSYASPTQQREVVQASFDESPDSSPVISANDAGWVREIQQRMSTADQSSTPAIKSSPKHKAHNTSFIDQERSSPQAEQGPTQKLITRIGINLFFVLALAIGFLLFLKNSTNAKRVAKNLNIDGQTLNVSQVLRLTNGAALHVVEGFSSKFLVAIDSSGIKSVDVLQASFEDSMHEIESKGEPTPKSDKLEAAQSTKLATESSRVADRTDASSELDQQLISLLLRGGKQAA